MNLLVTNLMNQIYRGLDTRAIIGQAALTAIYATFLLQMVELVGFNWLRIIFALINFTVFSQILLTVAPRLWLRKSGITIFVLLVLANLINFRYFGTTLQLGAVGNIGFLPYLFTQIMVLLRLPDILLTILGIAAWHAAARGPIWQADHPRVWLGILLGLFLSLQFVHYFAATQPSVSRAKEYGLDSSRWSIYMGQRFSNEDHTGSILMFGLTWTYISDALKLRGTGGAIEAISYDPVRFAKTDAPLRNIIAIQVEALDRTIINYELDGIPVTPFLNRLAAEHTYYDHVWAQHSSNGGTSDGDFSFLTAQYPLGYKGSLGARGLGQLPSVPRILSDNGYTAAAFHANRGAFFERKAGFIKLGFDRTYFKDEFTVTDPDRWHTLKDEAFFEQVGAVLDTTKQPYFAFLITLSSHSPFNMIGPEDYSIAFDGSTSLSANYFSSMRYVDEAIEKFVTTMREGDPEIVFLIYGDHTSKIHTANYTATDNNQLEPVPLIIADFSQPSNTRVSMPGSSIDFGPTLFHYLGYPAPEFWQGKALSSDGQPRPVYLIDAHHWITQEGSVEPITNGVNQQPEVKLIRRYLK